MTNECITIAIGALAVMPAACAEDEVALIDDSNSVQGALDVSSDSKANLAAIRRYNDVFESKDYDGVRALFADDFRQWTGSKFAGTVKRSEVLNALVNAWKTQKNLRRPQLILTDGSRALVFAIAWSAVGAKIAGPHAHIQLLSFKDGKIATRSTWMDVMTVVHLAGAPNASGGPETEAAWTELIEIAADGSEREATHVVRARELLEAIANRDAAAAADLVADGFVDRDFTRPAAQVFADESEFEAATEAWLGLSDTSIVRPIDVWAAGPYVVTHFSRSYRLAKDLDGYPGTAGHGVHGYQLWILRFDANGKIAARWMMSERLSTLYQIGAVNTNQFFADVGRATAGP